MIYPKVRRPARACGQQVRAGDRRRQARPPDQRLPPPAGRGQLRGLRSTAGRVAVEELPDDGAGGNRRGQAGGHRTSARPGTACDALRPIIAWVSPAATPYTSVHDPGGGERGRRGLQDAASSCGCWSRPATRCRWCMTPRRRAVRRADHVRGAVPAAGADRASRPTCSRTSRRRGEASSTASPRPARNTIARLAHGEAPNVLTQSALAFTGPLLVAPAMNPRMWAAPVTQENVRALLARGVETIGPESGEMAEGEQGARPHVRAGRDRRPHRGTPGDARTAWPGAGCWSPPAARASRSTPCATWATAPAGGWASPWPTRRPGAGPT